MIKLDDNGGNTSSDMKNAKRSSFGCQLCSTTCESLENVLDCERECSRNSLMLILKKSIPWERVKLHDAIMKWHEKRVYKMQRSLDNALDDNNQWKAYAMEMREALRMYVQSYDGDKDIFRVNATKHHDAKQLLNRKIPEA